MDGRTKSSLIYVAVFFDGAIKIDKIKLFGKIASILITHVAFCALLKQATAEYGMAGL